MTTWGRDDDPTIPQPRPQVPLPPIHVHEHVERRDSIMTALLVLLAFILSAIVLLSAMYTLYDALQHFYAVPFCREVTR